MEAPASRLLAPMEASKIAMGRLCDVVEFANGSAVASEQHRRPQPCGYHAP